MSSKKSQAGQASIRQFRSSVAKLKALGLVSARVDARSQKMTRYMRSQVAKFDDVLKGKAKVVTTPKRSDAKEFGERFRIKGKKIIVPVEKGETVRYSKKQGKIIGHQKAYGREITKEYGPTPVKSIGDLPTGSEILYTIPLGKSYRSFDTLADLETFMFPYATQARNPYKDWQKYVIIERPSKRSRRVSRPSQ